jgi:hypothetical protein
VDIDGLTLPKASGIDRIKQDFDKFISYWSTAKGGRPDRLILGVKFATPLKKSMRAQKLDADEISYKQIPITVLG